MPEATRGSPYTFLDIRGQLLGQVSEKELHLN